MSVAPSTRTAEEQLDLIVIYLRSGQPNLLIVATPDREGELAIAEEVRSRAGNDVKIDEIVLAADSIDGLSLSHQLSKLPSPQAHGALFVFGLDDLTEDSRTSAINAMNWGRERMRYAGYSVVLWVRPQTPGELGNRAPDFYSWRSDVFEFDLPSELGDRERMLARLRLFRRSTVDMLRTHYLDYVIRNSGWLDSRGLLQVRNVVRLHLDDVFIPLQVVTVSNDTPELPNGELSTSRDPRESSRYEGRSTEASLAIAEAMHRYQRLIVLGDPGSGKSTLLRFLALKFAQGDSAIERLLGKAEDRLPILVPLSSYSEARRVNPDLSLAEFLPRFFLSRALPDFSSVFDDAQRSGKVLFLLDGLDEVLTHEDRAASCRAIGELAASNPEARIIVTSRIAGFTRAMLPGDFAVSTILPFGDEDIRTFAERWSLAFESAGLQSIEALSPDVSRRAMLRAENLTEAVTAHPGLKRLATNPLLLTLLALIQHQGAKLPHRRADLYRLCIEALAETWNLARSLGETAIDVRLGERRLDEHLVVRILGPVALWIHETNETGVVKRIDLEEAIARQFISLEGVSPDEAKPLASDFLQLAREQTGLLVEVGLEEFCFLHLSFQEYLAARCLSETKEAFRRLKQRLHQPRWREIVLLTVASLRGDYASDFIENVLNAHAPFDWLLQRSQRLSNGELESSQMQRSLLSLMDLLLAAECICDSSTVRFKLREGVHDALMDLSAIPPFTTFRNDIAKCFSYLGGSEIGVQVLKHLLRVLRDKDHPGELRAFASETVTKISHKSSEVINTLIALVDDRNEAVQVRAGAARGLALVPTDQNDVVDALLRVLEDRSANGYVRESAARTLGTLRPADQRIVTKLLDRGMDESEFVVVRCDFLFALSHAILINPHLSDTLVHILLNKKQDAWVRRGAARALREAANNEAQGVVGALVRILEDKTESDIVRWGAADALNEVSKTDSGVADVLMNIALDTGDNANVRGCALLSTNWLNPNFEQRFLDLLLDKDADATLRSYAAMRLGFAAVRRNEKAIAALLSSLRDSSEADNVRGFAAWGLATARLRRADVTQTLLLSLQFPGSRKQVLEALWLHLQSGMWTGKLNK